MPAKSLSEFFSLIVVTFPWLVENADTRPAFNPSFDAFLIIIKPMKRICLAHTNEAKAAETGLGPDCENSTRTGRRRVRRRREGCAAIRGLSPGREAELRGRVVGDATPSDWWWKRSQNSSGGRGDLV